MNRYGFLRTRRWIGLAVTVVLVAIACVFLGTWQWDRHESRAATNEIINANYDTPVTPASDVVADTVPAEHVWRTVELSGTYTGEQVAVRNRPVEGTAAARVLALLRTGAADGGERLLVVDRGWVPLGDGDLVLPPSPQGEVSVVGQLRQAEPPDRRTAPAGQVYAIEPATVAAAVGMEAGELVDGYLMATTEDGTAPAGLEAFPRPETTPGSHLSYAFQWWVFAVGALVGFVVLARREAAELGGEAERPAGPPRRRSDADEEDALIEAQLGKG